jgi:hypothetical protein
MEAGRIDPRRSERVLKVYSPSILRLVRGLVSPTFSSSGSDLDRPYAAIHPTAGKGVLGSSA